MKFKNVTTVFSYLPEGTPGGQGGSSVTANPVQTGDEQLLNTLTINGVNYVVGGMEIYEPVVSTPTLGFSTAGSPVNSIGYGIQKDGYYEGLKDSIKSYILSKGGSIINPEGMTVTMLEYTDEPDMEGAVYHYQMGLIEASAETISSNWYSGIANMPENAFLATDGSTWLYQETKTLIENNGGIPPSEPTLVGYEADFHINESYSPDPYIQVKGTKQLYPTIYAKYDNGARIETTMQEDFYYTSSDSETATVSNTGLITGIKEGNVQITLHFGETNETASISLIITTQDIRAIHFGDSSVDELPFVQGQTFAQWCSSTYSNTPAFSFAVSGNKVGVFNYDMGGVYINLEIVGVSPSDVISDQRNYTTLMSMNIEQPEGWDQSETTFYVSGVKMNVSGTETFAEFVNTGRNIMGLEILGDDVDPSKNYVAYNLGPNMGNTRLPICDSTGSYVRPNTVISAEAEYFFIMG